MVHLIKIVQSDKKVFWIKFINKNRFINLPKTVDQVDIDFSNCQFIEPFHIVILSCLIEEYYLNKLRINFLKCRNLELDEYLNKINFYNYWTTGFDRNTYTPTKINTNLCLWKLEPSMISPYVLKAQEYFEKNFNTDKNFAPLNISLAELFNNVSDHSNSPVSGYCISQYYPNIENVKIAICDFGNGIPQSVNNYLQKNKNVEIPETEAIIKAIEKSFSTKSQPHNRGFGLDTIKSIVLECNGELRIVSNKAAYQLKNGQENTYLLGDTFNGTQIEIVLDTSTFEEKEKHFIDEDFLF